MQGSFRRFILTVSLAAALLAFGLSACTGAAQLAGETPTPTATPAYKPTAIRPTDPPVTPTIIVVNQRIPSTNVVVMKKIGVVHAGWISIHADAGGKPVSRSLGFRQVSKGWANNVSVQITNPAGLTNKLWAMLHIDNGRIGTFEFPGPDIQIVLDGKPYQVSFTVSR